MSNNFRSFPSDLVKAPAFYCLGLLSGKDLVDVASEALTADHDSPSLRILAGLSSPLITEAGPLFERALDELNLDIPALENAGLIAARFYAEQILSGKISPYEGSRRIWTNIYHKLEEPKYLQTFIGSASEIEDLPERYGRASPECEKITKFYEKQIMEEAEKLLRENPIGDR